MRLEDELSVEECQAALRKMLDHEMFFGSRRLSDFCRYSGSAALEGRSDLDQYEIAEKVLGKASDFNPWDDAAVRKLATQLRHKLETYYAGPGEAEPVVISLPKRSYLLRFRRRGKEEAVEDHADSVDSGEEEKHPEAPAAPEAGQKDRPVWSKGLILIAGIAAMGILAIGIFQLRKGAIGLAEEAAGDAVPSAVIEIESRRGDLRGGELDVAPAAVRIGPILNEGEEATVRLRFIPEHAGQTAGLMAFYDADNFVRLGPHYKDRSLMEFGVERQGAYITRESAYLFDPLGQTGFARWLAIRRTGPSYSAFLSSDGFDWKPYGNPLDLPDTSGDLRTAIYAFNGRSMSPPAKAEFKQFGAGLGFHNRADGRFQIEQLPGWKVFPQCKSPISTRVSAGALEVEFAADARGCAWHLLRPVPEGDFRLTALIDFEAISGGVFGITLQGAKASASLARRDLGGRSIMLSRDNDNDIRISDYPGSPPVILCLEVRKGIVTASVSRDQETHSILPGSVRTEDLGGLRMLGVFSVVAHWTNQQARPAARLYWIRIEAIEPQDLRAGNVP